MNSGFNPLLGGAAPARAEAVADEEEAAESNGDRLPGGMEATDGQAPEIGTHAVLSGADRSELSPEEQAISGLADNSTDGPKIVDDEDAETAGLADGSVEPPRGQSE